MLSAVKEVNGADFRGIVTLAPHGYQDEYPGT